MHSYSPYLPADLGIYQGDPSALHFPERKSGILRLKDPAAEGDESKDRCLQTTHAEPWFLRIVSFTHYLAFATQLAVALAYFNYVQPATTVASAAAVHVPFDGALPFLLIAGPLFQAMGGAGPNVMHEYEGFMVGLTLQHCCMAYCCVQIVFHAWHVQLAGPWCEQTSGRLGVQQ